jgi:hypothetical protein
MRARIWGKTLAALFLPAVVGGAELPRLTVFTPFPGQAAGSDPVVITASDAPLVTIVGTTADGCSPFFSPQVTPGRILLRGMSIQTLVPCKDEAWVRHLQLEPLPPGDYDIAVTLDEKPYASLRLKVTAPSAQVLLRPGEGVFYVSIAFEHPFTGKLVSAAPQTLSRQGAVFWFFNPTNPEVTIKILDGRLVNGHFWVFLASMTTIEFTARVEWCAGDDFGPCREKTYHSLPGQNLDVTDLTFFTGL